MTDHDGLYVRVDTVEKRVDKHSAEIKELQTWKKKMEKILLYAGLFLLGFLFRNPEIIERLIDHILNSQ
jgi:hypothetical protein